MNEEQGVCDERSIEQLSIELGRRLSSAQLRITTAESCTGGLIAGAITEVAGSSDWFERAAVTYSNAAKQALLGVESHVFEQYGAVSEVCVRAMADGALQSARADVAISVSGVAGPGGGTPEKPVGTVWIGWAIRYSGKPENDSINSTSGSDIRIEAEVFTFAGDRRLVRQQAVYQALRGTISRIDNAGLLKQ